MDQLSHRTTLIAVAAGALVVALVNIATFFVAPVVLTHWVVLHSILEGVSVVVASLIFAIGAAAEGRERLTGTRFIAFAFLAVAILDGLHLLSYGGMPDALVANTWHRNLFYWLAARLVSALALLLLATGGRWPAWRPRYAVYGLALVAVIVTSVFWLASFADDLIPLLFVEGVGPSRFKIAVEYIVIAANIATVVALLRSGERLRPIEPNLLIVAVSWMGVGELCFTVFASAGDLNNVVGHVMKTFAFLVLYRAVFVSAVRAPYRALQRSERQREASQAVVESAFGESASPKAIESLDGRYVRVNAAFAEFLGRSTDWFSARTWDAAVHPDDLSVARDVRAQLVDGAAAVPHREKRFIHADGSIRWGSISRSRISAGTDAAPLLLVELQDITDRKRAEVELQHSADALRQSQKTEAVGRLAGGIAHDFNNLLTAILSSTALLKDEIADNPTAVEDVAEVESAARRGAALTKQLLAFSRQQGWSPTDVELGSVVDDFAPVLRRLVTSSMHLQITCVSSPLVVRGDRSQLEQVVLNLVINARDALRDTGTIRVTTDRVVVSSPTTSPSGTLAAGTWAVLAVADDGCGMTPDVQAHIFDPFFTTKPLGQGTGLGLSTVYGIVQQHGGALVLESAPGRGSVFKVFLPLTADD